MWLDHPIILHGTLVRIEPLAEAHIPALVKAGNDPTIWTHLPFDGTDAARLSRELRTAILNRAHGIQYPFTVFAQQNDRVIGSTRFFDIFEEHKKLEIGWTWYARDAWGEGCNTECKLLLLTHCFETLRCNRVQLKTRATNERSCAAIEKLGATFEGVMRADRVMSDGSVRDTMLYSIIKEEWPNIKAKLERMVFLRQRTSKS